MGSNSEQHIYRSPYGSTPVRHTGIYNFVWANWYDAKDHKVAVVYAPTGEKMTRGELRDGTEKLGYGLRNTVKMKPGEVVLIFSPNSLYYHLLMLGCQCAGVVVSPANAAYSPAELAHQMKESQASLVFVHPQLEEVARKGAKEAGWSDQQIQDRFYLAVASKHAESSKLPSFDVLCENQGMSPHRIKDPRNTVAYLCFSSGTTSAAKGVQTTHSNMCAVLSLLGPFGAKASDVLIQVLPSSHIYGLTKLIHWPILLGMTVVVMPRFDLKMFCEIVPKYKATLAYLVPPIMLLLAKEKIVDNYDFSSLRYIVSGAAPLSPELEESLEKRLNILCRNAYGLTETSPTTHLCPLDKTMRGSIGYLLSNLEARVVNPETLEDVDEGKEGELWMRGPSIMKGYHNRPEATAETLVQGGWLRTGDVVYVKDDFFFVTDRIKELIKYKGFQVPPAELEAVLIAMDQINDAAVIGAYSDKDATELPRAYVVPRNMQKAKADAKAFEKEVQDAVAAKVANHKKLRGGVVIVEEIAKSASGKLLRRHYKERYAKEEAPQSKAKL